MDLTALATAITKDEKKEAKLYGIVFYDNEYGGLMMYQKCFSQVEYDLELAHAVRWAESEPSPVGVRGVPAGGVA